MNPLILKDLAESFGLVPEKITPVSGGWLNEKWRVQCAGADVLVKQLSLTRYSEKGIREIEAALQRQLRLKDIPCPRLHCAGETIIRRLDESTAYLVMDFCEGYQPDRETVTPVQMRDLGRVLGKIHRQFDALENVDTVRGYPFSGETILHELREERTRREESLTTDAPKELRRALEDWKRIADRLSAEYLDSLPRGVGHEDFTPDNMLFTNSGVAAIVDVDRNQYGFRFHDVGRALVSFALEENGLNPEKTDAFLDGYSSQYPFDRTLLPDVLCAVWCVEAPWWINEKTFASENPKLQRFLKEMLWLTEVLFEDKVVCENERK